MFQHFTKNNKPIFFVAFLNNLFSNKLFRRLFRSKRTVHGTENDQINILFKTSTFNSHFSIWKLFLNFAATAINYVSLSLWTLSKDFFITQGIAVLDMDYTTNDSNV